MKFPRVLLALILVLSVLLIPAAAFAAGPEDAGLPAGQEEGTSFAAGRILVKFKTGVSETVRQNIHRANGAAVVDEIKGIGVQVLKVPNGKVSEKVLAYRAHGAVEFAEPDYIATAFEVDPNPYLAQQWGMARIDAPEAWADSKGAGIKIAILDTGIDKNHEDLAGKIVSSRNFTDSDTDDDRYGHGTHVAGIVSAATDNGIGVAGVGHSSSLMNCKVLNDTGSGAFSWIASGIVAAADDGANVINMSLGAKIGSTALLSAVNYAWSRGVVIVASAGNNGTKQANYPAYYANCIAVAATDPSDAKASFSTYGDWVDVAAPGTSILSTLPNHANEMGALGYGSLSGTSMAAPHVAGLAALVWAKYGGTNTTVRSRIEGSAEETGSIWTSYGIPRINAHAAVDDGQAANTAPVVNISAPASGASFAEGSSISFSGTATDAEDGDRTSSLVWRSSPDVVLGLGGSFTATLAAGTYTITAEATDTAGATGTASVSITVTSSAANDPIKVESCDPASIPASYWVNSATWKTSVLVTISPALAGATVSGTWSNGTTGSAITGTEGKCAITSGNISKKVASITFTVTSISLSGYAFDPSGDNDVTILRP